jgi:hypothetical protein
MERRIKMNLLSKFLKNRTAKKRKAKREEEFVAWLSIVISRGKTLGITFEKSFVQQLAFCFGLGLYAETVNIKKLEYIQSHGITVREYLKMVKRTTACLTTSALEGGAPIKTD